MPKVHANQAGQRKQLGNIDYNASDFSMGELCSIVKEDISEWYFLNRTAALLLWNGGSTSTGIGAPPQRYMHFVGVGQYIGVQRRFFASESNK